MAKIKLKEKALKLRKEGKSYSQIKKEINVSKSTLSLWLRDYPLSAKRIKELRDNNPRRIEMFRNTMQKKRDAKKLEAYNKATQDIGDLSEREKFIAGLFLYWGEGTKASRAETSVSNTDPAVLQFFIEWLNLLKVDISKLGITLHLYSDMNEESEVKWWSDKLNIPKKQFTRCYIKKSSTKDISYRREFTHGTCNVRYWNQPMSDYVLMALKKLREISELENKTLCE